MTEAKLLVAGSGGDGAAADAHATVLGLKAFVLAAPYDVPPWLPEVLLALVRAAGQPPPVKTSVRCVRGLLRGVY